MKIMVRYYGSIAYQTNKHNEELTIEDGMTIRNLFDQLVTRYGTRIRDLCFPTGEMRQCVVTINRQDLNNSLMFPDGLDTVIKENDTVALIGALSGG